MFKKVIQSISKSLSGKPAPTTPAPARQTAPAPSRANPEPAGRTGGKSVLQRLASTPAAAPTGSQTPEGLCGIAAGMTKSEISARLKLLYRRYNRAASSLDASTRAEADRMLDAIVQVREKHFGEL